MCCVCGRKLTFLKANLAADVREERWEEMRGEREKRTGGRGIWGPLGDRVSTRKARQPRERVRVWIEEPDIKGSKSQLCHFPAV